MVESLWIENVANPEMLCILIIKKTLVYSISFIIAAVHFILSISPSIIVVVMLGLFLLWMKLPVVKKT